MKKTTKIILITLGVIILAIAGAGMYKFNYLSGQDGYDVDGNKITKTQQAENSHNTDEQKAIDETMKDVENIIQAI